jgi:hypothetical protein
MVHEILEWFVARSLWLRTAFVTGQGTRSDLSHLTG